MNFIRKASLGILLVLLSGILADAKTVRHYVFFGLDRDKIREARSFLETPEFEGAQVAYFWKQLEPRKDVYDLSLIREDLAFLRSKGKRLFIQIQDVTFSPQRVPVPKYLIEDKQYGGGANQQYQFEGPESDDKAKPGGWMARRWDSAVRERFHKLLSAIAKEFDGQIEGINLAETSSVMGSTGKLFPPGFTHAAYRDAIISNMKALRQAFQKSTVLIYANFMPGDWLPATDNGYLRSVYAAAKELKVGVGGPDVFPYKPGQMNNSYHLIHDVGTTVPVGMAVQDGNYDHVIPKTGKRVTAKDIYDFAAGYLRADYIFWCTEEPFYTGETIPFVKQTR